MAEESSQSGAGARRCSADCAGAVLAGGRSRRMGGGRKALETLAGRPLLSHVVARLQPQVDVVVLSVDQQTEQFEPFGLMQVPDLSPGSNGPLGGLAAVLRYTECEGYSWLQLAPCDAPFLPMDLTARLRDLAEREERAVSLAAWCGRLQPVFSLWHVSLRYELEAAVSMRSMGGFREFLGTCPHATLEWPATKINPFFNINDRQALREAEGMTVGNEEETA